MNKQTFLESLPFLHLIPTSTPIQIWKSHRTEIIEYIQSSAEGRKVGKNDTSAERNENRRNTAKEDCCLFSPHSHVLSIEPNIHHDGQSGKPAFFKRCKGSNSSSNGDDRFHFDPALTGFTAFLLPAEIQGDDHPQLLSFHSPAKHSQHHAKPQPQPQHQQQQQTSPTFSTASTSMSVTPQQQQQQHQHQHQQAGGKFENSNSSNSHECNGNGHIDERNNEITASTLLRTHLLYFLFDRDDDNCIIQSSSSSESCHGTNIREDSTMKSVNGKRQKRRTFDIYFVDYYRVNELEIVLPPSVPVSSMPQKPTSLLIKFDSCNFRIFHRNFLQRHPHRIQRNHRHGITREQQYMGSSGDGDSASRSEQQLRNCLKRIQECIFSHHERTLQLRYFNNAAFPEGTPPILCSSSIYPYLFCMTHPAMNCDSQHGFNQEHRHEASGTIDENRQIAKAPTTMDKDVSSKPSNPSNHTGDDSNTNNFSEERGREMGDGKITTDGEIRYKDMSSGMSKTSMSDKKKINDGVVEGRRRTLHGRKRKYRCYEKSWKSLEKIHNILNSRTSLDGLSNHEHFASLLETSANELRNSYIIDEAVPENGSSDTYTSTNIVVSREAESTELHCKMSLFQHSIDESIQRIFPSSSMVGRASSRKKDKGSSTSINEEHDIENNLKEYRKAIAAQHMLAFLPSR